MSTKPGQLQYPSSISDFCDLMYNYFSAGAGSASVVDPYVKLIHEILGSNAYAFSIDDAVSFKSVPGSGVIIITVAGDNGLENKTQTPLPTASTYKGFCQSTPKKWRHRD
ncbi:MAG: hypothetical protein ACREE5_06315 [Acetobacteraceae bacterium]